MKFLIFFLFVFVLSFPCLHSKDDSKNYDTEKIIGLNYHFVYDKEYKLYTNYINISYQISDKLDNRVLIPFYQCDLGFNTKNDDPKWHLALILGFKDDLFTTTNKVVFGVVDLGFGLIAGKTNNLSYSGLMGKLGLSFGFHNIIFRYGINLYSYDFPYKSDIVIGLNYAF